MHPCSVVAAVLVLRSCGSEFADTGFPENRPGQEAVLEYGEVAVDDVAETVFVMRRAPMPPSDSWFHSYEEWEEAALPSRIFALPPDGPGALAAADTTGLIDVRIVFPRDGVLLIAERYEGSHFVGDELRLLDRATFEETARGSTRGRFYDPRLSPSRKWLAAVDGDPSTGPVAVIDTATLASAIMSHGAGLVETTWYHESDRLLVAILYDVSCGWGCSFGSDPRLRVLSWSVEAVAAGGFAVDRDGLWRGAEIDVTVPVTLPAEDSFAGLSGPAISPDDKVAALGVLALGLVEDPPGGVWESTMMVLDLETADLRTVDGARDILGFTGDGSGIVCSQCVPSESDSPFRPRCRLLLVDRGTLAVEPVDLPGAALSSVIVPREGRRLVASGVRESPHGSREPAGLFTYDLDLRHVGRVAGPPVGLGAYVSREDHGEIWLLDSGLFRLDPAAAVVRPVPLGWAPASVNVLPRRDRLVLFDRGSWRIVFLDPATGSEVRSVRIPVVPSGGP